MWKKICLVLTGIILGAVTFALADRTVTFSNDANMTLAAGKSYEITNIDKSDDVYISTTGSKKYDYVSTDAYNEVAGYGSSSGSIFVTAGGKTSITVGEVDLSILYSDATVKIKEISGEVIKRFSIQAGKSLEITNKNSERSYSLSSESSRFSSKQDCVSKDAVGNVISYAAGSSFLMDIPAAGSLVITARDNDLNLYAPAKWISSDLSVKNLSNPALFTYDIPAGKTVSIVNQNAESGYSISCTGGRSSNSRYDYVVKNTSGIVSSYGDSDLNSDIVVEAGGTTIVSAPINSVLTICFPYEWKTNSLTITEQNRPALTQYTFAAGKTVEIINADTNNRYSIAIGGMNQEGAPKVDYVFKDAYDNVTDYGSEYIFDIIPVSEGGVSLISVGSGGNMKIWFPYEWSEKTIKVSEKNTQVLSYYSIDASKSLLIKNGNPYEDFSIMTSCIDSRSNGHTKYDYVSKDSSAVVDYASESKAESFMVLAGGETLVTSGASANLKVWFPNEWDKNILTVSNSDKNAIFYYTVNAMETVELKNATAYAEFDIKIKNAPVKYDYTTKNEEGLITACESGQNAGVVNLSFGGSARLTAKTYSVVLMFPQEWHNTYVRAVQTDVEAVYAYVIPAGKSASLINGGNPLNVFTNSQSIEYVTRNEMGRVINCMPKGSYNSFKVEGGGSAVISSGKAYDTKLFLPNEMIENGTLKLNESENPAVYVDTVKPGSGLMLVNSNTSETFNVSLNFAGGRGTFDYAVRDSAGKVIEYEGDSSLSSLYVPAGGTLQFTIKGNDEAAICLPYEWTSDNLTLTSGTFKTINSYILRSGRTVEIANLDKDYMVQVSTNSAVAFGAPKFDYVYYNAKSEITGYGHNNVFGNLIVMNGGKTLVTASPGADLEIFYPASWDTGKLSITETASPALTHYTVRVGGSLQLSNNSNKDYTIQTNSDSSLASPKYFRESGSNGMFNANMEPPVSGNILLSSYTEVRLIVERGSDLNLWMPTEWLNNIKTK